MEDKILTPEMFAALQPNQRAAAISAGLFDPAQLKAGMMTPPPSTDDSGLAERIAAAQAAYGASDRELQAKAQKDYEAMTNLSYRIRLLKWLQAQRAGMGNEDAVLPVAQRYWTDQAIGLLQPPPK